MIKQGELPCLIYSSRSSFLMRCTRPIIQCLDNSNQLHRPNQTKDAIHLRKSHLFQHDFRPCRIAVIVSADTLSGNSTAIPFPLILIQEVFCIGMAADNGDSGTISCFSEHFNTDSITI